MKQLAEEYTLLLVTLVLAIGLVAIMLRHSEHRRSQMRRKLSQARKTQDVPKGIIILAIEISNFIVLYSDKHRNNYKHIDVNQKSLVVRLANYLTNASHCFFQRFNRKAIRKFFKEIKAIENLKLVLYTNLERQVANKILENLAIDSCFDPKDRIYTHADFKIADLVDSDTGRVIILSANSQDLDRSVTSHHGLILQLGRKEEILQESILNDLKDCFVELASSGRADTLHQDMHILTNQKGLPVLDDDSI